jgi:hypothetical protein
MLSKTLLAAAALLAASSANAAIIYEHSGVLDQFNDAFEGYALSPGKYLVSVSFDADATLATSSFVEGIFIYDIDCGGFICGGSDGPLGWAYVRRSPRSFEAAVELRPAHRDGSLIFQADRGVFSRIATFGPAGYTFAISSAPEPASWALMIAGFGLAGAALRRRPTPAIA